MMARSEEIPESTRLDTTEEDLAEMGGGDPHGDGPRSPTNMIELNFSANNLMEEIDGDGWLNITRPVGDGALNKLPTVGGRGAENTPAKSNTRSDPRS